MLKLTELLSDTTNKGLIKVNEMRNSVLSCTTVSTNKTWFIALNVFQTRVKLGEIEIIGDDTFKFKTRTAEEIFKA